MFVWYECWLEGEAEGGEAKGATRPKFLFLKVWEVMSFSSKTLNMTPIFLQIEEPRIVIKMRLCLQKKDVEKRIKAKHEDNPEMRKRSQKLSMPRILESENIGLVTEQVAFFPNHLFSMFFISSPSVTFKIDLETSGKSGEPLGKTCSIHIHIPIETNVRN